MSMFGGVGEVRSVAFSPDGNKLASSSDDLVRVWSASSGQVLAKMVGHDLWVYAIAFAPDGSKVVSGGADRTVRVWSALTGQQLAEMHDPSNSVCAVAFSRDGRMVASGNVEGGIRVWEEEEVQEGERAGDNNDVNASGDIDGGSIDGSEKRMHE